LPTFLEAIAAWVADSEGFFRSIGQPIPTPETWKLVAIVLQAATIYE
jgi:hypothetical protein